MQPRSGSVVFDGTAITGLRTPQIIRRGLGSVPEARRLFGGMTVRENVLMGAFTRSDKPDIAQDYERMMKLFPRLRERSEQPAGTLSGGEQQMVAMARALMGRPRVICMDEPTMGLSPLYVDRVLELIQKVNQEGVTDLHGRAERASRAADRRLRLCPADRPHRAVRAGARSAARSAHPRRLSRRSRTNRGAVMQA